MKERPDFDKITSSEEFNLWYWYVSELRRICRNINIPHKGTKAELEKRICCFLDNLEYDNCTEPLKRAKRSGNLITLESSIIKEGIRGNEEFRQFLSRYFNVKRFKFTKEMMASVRFAENKRDENFTVKDAIEAYEKFSLKGISNCAQDDKILRWNQFVKDFCKDERSSDIKKALAAAAFLWKKVREGKGSKKYHPEMFDLLPDEFFKK